MDRMTRQRTITGAILLVASAVMFYPLALSWRGRDIPMVQDLGFSGGSIAPIHSWIAAMLFATMYILYTFRVVPFVRENQSELSGLKLIGIFAAIASGIMEEVVFRRWVMDSAMSHGVSAPGQVLLSGVLFGLAHLAWMSFSRERHFSIYGIAATVVAGWALGAIYLLSGRELGPCILAHVAINLVVEPWLVLAAVSGAQTRSFFKKE